MAFSLPNFNLKCDVYSGPWSSKALRLSNVDCNLAFGKRVQRTGSEFGVQYPWTVQAQILFPPGTDVRDVSCAPKGDIIECPRGTGRWYTVVHVDDLGKGFPNEHRFADVAKADSSIDLMFPTQNWPTPIP